MTRPTAQYPAAVWDKTSVTRSINDDKAPDYEDWDQMVAEIVAIETELTAGLDDHNVKSVANAAILGGIPLVFRIDVGDATADTDVVVTSKIRIIDVVVVKTVGNGGAGDTLTVKNGSTAVTNAMITNMTDKTIVRAGTIDDASHEIAAGGTLRCSANKATNAACIVYVHAIKVP